MNLDAVHVARERLVAADPGLLRLRLGAWAVLGIALASVVLVALRRPLPTIMVTGIAATTGSPATSTSSPA
ncbi:MAG TPA: hypothetical protein VJT49_07445 [Amycolatopsis sp.]|uniref:hypothetical protein n=1 Tax=Amycolatopsis sp. TaxID=37632 RepID=UPI002B49A486|nr:hypothetical protein [Amycolatopsis sp.]HKS44941.1 hypothetical protein [Amycolatopsis sp.]